MSNIEKAIKIAEKNGHVRERYMSGEWVSVGITLLDPTFWQALGKGLGWENRVCFFCGEKYRKIDGEYHEYCDKCSKPFHEEIPEYKYHWHRFIDHLAEGKDAESFFKELL